MEAFTAAQRLLNAQRNLKEIEGKLIMPTTEDTMTMARDLANAEVDLANAIEAFLVADSDGG